MRTRPRTALLGAVVALCLLSVGWALLWRERPAPLPAMRVEVLNGSGIAGLGLRCAQRLRQLGQDVVRVGDAEHAAHARSLLLDRRAHPLWSRRLARELGDVPVLLEAIEGSDVDATLLLGADAERTVLAPSR
jgi:hypothetical protein